MGRWGNRGRDEREQEGMRKGMGRWGGEGRNIDFSGVLEGLAPKNRGLDRGIVHSASTEGSDPSVEAWS